MSPIVVSGYDGIIKDEKGIHPIERKGLTWKLKR
jgi:hypothetical protein